MSKKSISLISNYYNNKFALHGLTPLGVDWNSKRSQIKRFNELSKIIDTKKNFSINDFGCGYGALYDFLLNSDHKNFQYFGNDISSLMIKAAQERYIGHGGISFVESSKHQRV